MELRRPDDGHRRAGPPPPRRADTPRSGPGGFPAQLSEFISDEVSAALTLSARTADAYLDLALGSAPSGYRTLRRSCVPGVIDHLKARLIAESTRILSDADARAVEARILPLWPDGKPWAGCAPP